MGESIISETILYLELNSFGILILIILLGNMHIKHRAATFDQQLFTAVMSLGIVMLVLDTLMFLLDGKTFPSALPLNYVVTTLYYICQPLICVTWALYADYKLNEKLKRFRVVFIAAAVIIVVNTLLSLLSIKYDIYFTIDANNVYSRGQHLWAGVALSYISFLYSLILVFTSKRNKKYKTTILFFPLFTFAASILQLIFYGLTLIWTSAAISCVMVYINIQNTRIATDGLTGLFNRCHLRKYLDGKAGSKKRNVFVIMLDVNNLKAINDTHGHKMGDEALLAVSSILTNAVTGTNCIVARYGGDEFCVGGICEGEQFVKDLVEQIYSGFADYNKKNHLSYKLSACMGYAVWDKSNKQDFSAIELISLADAKMYEDKARGNC